MESPNGSWSWQLLGTDRVLSEALDVLNNNEENESDLSTQHQDKECKESVADLLNQWDVAELAEHFIANKVDLKSLQYARYHQLADLLQNMPWGIKVKFEHCLFEWQKSIGTYVNEDMHQNDIKTSQVVEKPVELDVLSSTQINEENTTELFNLKSVLNKYNEGKTILKLIDLNIKELPEAQRQILVDKIVDFFIQNDKKISVSLARTITDQILCLFPDSTGRFRDVQFMSIFGPNVPSY